MSMVLLLLAVLVIGVAKMSGGGYRIPPLFSESKPYNRWIDELNVWRTVTELSKSKQAPAIALSLPENEGCVRDKVFSELGADKLNKDDGVETLLAFMDKIYKKDELSEAYELYTSFDRFKRDDKISMENYVSEFEKLYNRTAKFNMSLPESVLAFKLLEGACLSHKDRQLVLTGVDYAAVDSLFQQMCISLKKFFGQQSLPNSIGYESLSGTSGTKVKLEPAFIADKENEVFINRRWNPRFRGRSYGGTRKNYSRGRSSFNRQQFPAQRASPGREQNPVDAKGQPMRCIICESIFHFAKDCQHSYENIENKVYEVSWNNGEEAVLFTGNRVSEIGVLLSESKNCGVLDSACSSTVAGELWMDCYLDSLSAEQYDTVTNVQSTSVFKFGGGTVLESKGKVTFPCEIAGVKCRITSDVVQSDIPLLLGKPSMKAAGVVLNLHNDSATIFNKEVQLNCTSSGHYCVPVLPTSMPNETFEVLFSMGDKTLTEKQNIISKLHKQFAHPSVRRFKILLQDAGAFDQSCEKIINDIVDRCDVCRKFKKTPARPVVSLPLATQFNDVVALDLKEWKTGIYFLHLIDVATRFSLAAVIRRKLPEVVIDKIMCLWIGSGMGPPKRFITDNGDEDHITEKCELSSDKCKNVKVKDQIQYLPEGESNWLSCEVISRGGKATGKYRSWFNVKNLQNGEICSVDFDKCNWKFLCENSSEIESENVLENGSEIISEIQNVNFVVPLSRHSEYEIKSAKVAELENWKAFNCYESVKDEGQPYLSTRWVVTEKYDDLNKHRSVKARLVARGFEEDEKVRSDSPTATKETLRIVLCITASMSWKCRTIDIKAAFLQGKSIEREVFLRPPIEVPDNDNVLWRLNKCVYGLNDASRNWYFRVQELLFELKCKQSEVDLGLFMMHSNENLEGLVMMHVDDFIWAGSQKFETDVIQKLKLAFKIGKQACGIFTYIGLEITQNDNQIILDQLSYIQTLKQIPISKERVNQKQQSLNKLELRQLRGIIGQINWVTNQTRPDTSYESLELCISVKDPKVEHLVAANKLIRKLQLENSSIIFPKLDLSNIRLGLYCDASYANLSDGVSSAEGFIIFLIDSVGNCCPLAWKSNKIHRIVKSTLAAETLALVDGLDTTYYLSFLLGEILYNKKTNCIPIECYTDNMSLYENIHSTKSVNEKRLRVDIASIKQMVQKGEISKVAWIDSCHQLSDCLTKKGASSQKLLDILRHAHIQ